MNLSEELLEEARWELRDRDILLAALILQSGGTLTISRANIIVSPADCEIERSNTIDGDVVFTIHKEN